MNKLDFLQLMDAMHEEEKAEHQRKSADYAERDGSNVLANFERVAERLGITPEMALAVYAHKHWDAIMAYCKYGDVTSEGIEGRIKDARVYLALLRGMVEQEKEMQSRVRIENCVGGGNTHSEVGSNTVENP